MIKLSIICPSIRVQNIPDLLMSIYNATDEKIELIVVGPYAPPIYSDIKWIQSWRSPNACQQEGLMEATGQYVCVAADDGIFLPCALDHALDIADYKTIVVGKYIEGDDPHPDMLKEDYYKFGYHRAYQLKGVPQDCLIFNCGIISRKFILELGGWDAQHFDVPTIGHADLGIRAFKNGANMILMDKPMFQCSHQPGNSGDHAPINRAMKKDLKKLKYMYGCQNVREKIYLNNWERTPEVWSERFGKQT